MAAEPDEQPLGLAVGACNRFGSRVVKRLKLSAFIDGAVTVGFPYAVKLYAAVKFDAVVSKAAAFTSQGMRMLQK